MPAPGVDQQLFHRLDQVGGPLGQQPHEFLRIVARQLPYLRSLGEQITGRLDLCLCEAAHRLAERPSQRLLGARGHQLVPLDLRREYQRRNVRRSEHPRIRARIDESQRAPHAFGGLGADAGPLLDLGPGQRPGLAEERQLDGIGSLPGLLLPVPWRVAAGHRLIVADSAAVQRQRVSSAGSSSPSACSSRGSRSPRPRSSRRSRSSRYPRRR